QATVDDAAFGGDDPAAGRADAGEGERADEAAQPVGGAGRESAGEGDEDVGVGAPGGGRQGGEGGVFAGGGGDKVEVGIVGEAGDAFRLEGGGRGQCHDGDARERGRFKGDVELTEAEGREPGADAAFGEGGFDGEPGGGGDVGFGGGGLRGGAGNGAPVVEDVGEVKNLIGGQVEGVAQDEIPVVAALVADAESGEPTEAVGAIEAEMGDEVLRKEELGHPGGFVAGAVAAAACVDLVLVGVNEGGGGVLGQRADEGGEGVR